MRLSYNQSDDLAKIVNNKHMQIWQSIESLTSLSTALNWAGIITGILSAIFALVSAFTLGGNYLVEQRIAKLNPLATAAQLARVENRIGVVSGHFKGHFTWDQVGATPFGEAQTPFGGELGDEIFAEIQRTKDFGDVGQAEFKLMRKGPYRYRYFDSQSGEFECDLRIDPGAFPLGAQLGDLLEMKYLRILVPMKQYNVGFQQYNVTIVNADITLNVNGIKVARQFVSRPTQPHMIYSNMLTGYVDQRISLDLTAEFGSFAEAGKSGN